MRRFEALSCAAVREMCCEVFALDLPGFGESPPGSSALMDLVDAVADLCSRAGIERPHVAGNSMGGAIALELGRRGVARSVTAFSPIGFWHTPGRMWCQLAMGTERRLAARLQPMLPAIARSPLLRAVALGLVFGKPRSLDPCDVLADLDAAIDAVGFEQASASFTGYRFSNPGPLEQVPTTVAWGRRDILLNYGLQHRRARMLLPCAWHVSLRGCGHTPFYDDPIRCAQVVLTTVARASNV